MSEQSADGEERLWPDDLEVGDSVEIDGHTYEVVGTGPAEATLERADNTDMVAEVCRWAVSNTVGIELKKTVSQAEFRRSVDTDTGGGETA